MSLQRDLGRFPKCLGYQKDKKVCDQSGKMLVNQARRNEIDIGGLRAKRAKMGVRGLSPGKIFQVHALFIAGNALSVQITKFKCC